MGQLLLFIVVAVVVAAIVFGVTVMLGGGDSGLTPVEADGHAVPLPTDRPLGEEDMGQTRFDVAWRGYRMAQVDQALQRAAYDIGYKGELIGVLEAEVAALREGRLADADVLRKAREAAVAPVIPAPAEGPVIELSVIPPDEIAADSEPVEEKAPVAEKAPAGEKAPAEDEDLGKADEKAEESEAAERR
ncbi:DivIVA domain-containing protein [Actinoplanes sp. NPDC051343]|uniref:DivIVA domain-containing protein n=1 Tax=Actinoplanes sp. NPDC051343 TaxID=3363906 RepID=UPI00378B9CCD